MSMNSQIRAIDSLPSFQTSEGVHSMPSAQQPSATWQGREVNVQGQRVEEPGSVVAGMSNLHIMEHVFSFLSPSEAARSALACRFFRTVKQWVDLEQVRTLALAFGLPKDFACRVEGSSCRPLGASTLSFVVTKLIQIERTLPEALRKNNDREALRTLAQNPTWLRGFLQTAYDNQLLLAFGEAAEINLAQSFAYQVRQVRQWFDTSPQIMYLYVQRNDLLLLPTEVTRLLNLQFLIVRDTQIAELPDLTPLTRLQLLNVSGNRLTTLPDVTSLPNLRLFNVSNNHIIKLPEMSQLSHLHHFSVDRNPIAELPPFSRHANLQSVSATHTYLTTLPDMLFQLPRLRVIFAFGNPLLVLPEEQQPLIDAFRSRGGHLAM